MASSCLLGLGISHLIFESCAEWLEIRFEESDISAHHAEMGNLLSLYPKIHGLRADAEEDRCLSHGQRDLFGKREGEFPNRVGRIEGEAFDIHACLYELLCFYANQQETMETSYMQAGPFYGDGPLGLLCSRDHYFLVFRQVKREPSSHSFKECRGKQDSFR